MYGAFRNRFICGLFQCFDRRITSNQIHSPSPTMFMQEESVAANFDISRPQGVLVRSPEVPVIPFNMGSLSSSRIVSRLICPKKCTKVPSSWVCETCQSDVFFSLSDWCFCVCGRYSIHAAEYRCNMPGHELASPISEFIPEEQYNIAVICKAREPRAKWLTWAIDPVVPIGCPNYTYEVRQAQRLFRFVDITQESDLKEFHAICIVLPLYGNIRAQLFETIALLGRNALKNVIVCMPNEKSAGINSKSLVDNVNSLNLGIETNFTTFYYEDGEHRNQASVNEFLNLVCGMTPPIERQLSSSCASGPDAVDLANALKNICRTIEHSISWDIAFLREDQDNTRRKTFILTSSVQHPNVVPQLLDAEVQLCEFNKETGHGTQFLVEHTPEKMDKEAVKVELKRLEEKKSFFALVCQQLECQLRDSAEDDLGMERIQCIKEFVLASSYREVIQEYLSIIEPPKNVCSTLVVRCHSKSLLPLPKISSSFDSDSSSTALPNLSSDLELPRKCRGRRRRARGGRHRGRGGRRRRSRQCQNLLNQAMLCESGE